MLKNCVFSGIIGLLDESANLNFIHGEKNMNNDAIFDDISIMGRVIYIIYVIEIYIKEREVTEEWNRLLEALWSFPEFDKCIDDYAYKVIECTPETILDDREDFTSFEHFSEEELYVFRDLYTRSTYTQTIDYLMGQINEILAYNLYTSVKPPEEFSLRIINETYQYVMNLLGDKTPSTEPFEIYSIHEQQCYGNYTLGKEGLLAHMNE